MEKQPINTVYVLMHSKSLTHEGLKKFMLTKTGNVVSVYWRVDEALNKADLMNEKIYDLKHERYYVLEERIK